MTGSRPPFDRELQPYLDATLAHLPSTIGVADVPGMRVGTMAMFPPIAEVLEGTGVRHRDITVPGPAGQPDIVLAIFDREGRHESRAPLFYNIHGGGMVIGDRFTGAEMFPHLVQEFGAVIVSVEYRLAPENPHPAPVEDCYAGLLWTVKHAAELGADPDRLLVMGGSAGGGLAAAVTLLARDRQGPALIGSLLMCPMLDDRNQTISSAQFSDGTVWNKNYNEMGWQALLGDAQGGADVSPYAAPARATDLSGLPPTYIDVGSAEVFRDEDIDYASRIWAAGGSAELHVWSGGFHGFEVVRHAAVSQAAAAARESWIGRVLGPASGTTPT
jgi:acetyl esterase/lipase